MPLHFPDDSVHDFLLYHFVPTLKVDLSRVANSAHSTASRYFSKDDMPTIPNEWSEFNYWDLCKEFSEELQATMPPGARPVSMSPPPATRVELTAVDAYVRVIFPQVRRAMEALNLDVRTDRSSLRDHPTDRWWISTEICVWLERQNRVGITIPTGTKGKTPPSAIRHNKFSHKSSSTCRNGIFGTGLS